MMSRGSVGSFIADESLPDVTGAEIVFTDEEMN